jgi:hypothetical protein
MEIKKALEVIKNYVNDEECRYLENDREELMELACLLVLRTMGINETYELNDLLTAGLLNGYENSDRNMFPELFHDTLQKVLP